MISVTWLIREVFAALFIAGLMTWQMYRQDKYVAVNNKWLPILKRLPRPINLGLRIFMVFVAMYAIADVVWIVEPYLRVVFGLALHTLGIQGIELVIGIGVVIFGFIAYLVKSTHPITYGILEVVFAGSAGVITAKQLIESGQIGAPIATLIGAIYVVSRGLNNIDDGLEKKRKKLADAKKDQLSA